MLKVLQIAGAPSLFPRKLQAEAYRHSCRVTAGLYMTRSINLLQFQANQLTPAMPIRRLPSPDGKCLHGYACQKDAMWTSAQNADARQVHCSLRQLFGNVEQIRLSTAALLHRVSEDM